MPRALTAARSLAGARIPLGSYAGLILAAAPSGYWRLGVSGGDAPDSTPNGQTAVAAGGITYSVAGAMPADGNLAVTLNGSTGYFNAGNSPALNFGTGDFSVELWLNITSITAADQVFASKTAGDGGAGWRFSVTATTGLLKATFNDGSGSISSVGGFAPTAGNWYHVVYTARRNSVLLRYVNGKLYGTPFTISAKTGSVNNAGGFAIGARSGASLPCGATLQDVAAYNYVLTEAQVWQHYMCGQNAARSLSAARSLVA